VPADETTLRAILAEIAALPADWHGAGSLAPPVLEAIVRHCSRIRVEHSAETGSGRSTLLFSHLSAHHEVFALDDGGSITRVLESPLLDRASVHYVNGPTQLTLPAHRFAHTLQAALIDGPHQYPCPDLEYFYIHRHLGTGAIFVLDDIDIPTVHNLFAFLKADEMFRLLEVVGATAFFERTAAPHLDPDGDYRDRWWMQGYNKRKRLTGYSPTSLLKWVLPSRVKSAVRGFLRRRGI